MGFAWVEDISVGTAPDAADIIEIRTNVDVVDDEKCVTHRISYDIDYKDGDDASHNPGYYNDEHTTYDDGNLAGYDGTDNSGYNYDEHSTYNNGDQVGVDSSYNGPAFSDEQGTYNAGLCVVD